MRKLEKWLPSLIIAAVLLISMAGGAAYAKYVTGQQFSGSVTVTANIGTVEIWQTPVAYGETVGFTENGDPKRVEEAASYLLIPGVDIPNDAYVKITDNTGIEAYVYLKVEATLEQEYEGFVYYALAAGWQLLDGYSNVYYTTVSSDAELPILSNGCIYVSQYLKDHISGEVSLRFSATLRQTVDGKTPEEIYEDTQNYG